MIADIVLIFFLFFPMVFACIIVLFVAFTVAMWWIVLGLFILTKIFPWSKTLKKWSKAINEDFFRHPLD